tara:strand:+ start:152 stop:355 length:204 start_codon:yes stop_codon:yes gene_type:complete
MATTIDIHHVTSIKVKERPVSETNSERGYIKQIRITDENGHKYDLTLFADDLESLSFTKVATIIRDY